MAEPPMAAELRPLLFSIAYRMVGGVTDAEDIVQEAFLPYHLASSDGSEIGSPKAWLSAVTTRLAIDHLRSARVNREAYVGPWLPEPLLADPTPDLAEHAEVSDSLSMAFLVLLESLSPVERAVFLLREVFGYGYDEIAAVVGRSQENCRQLAVRARRHLEERKPRFEADRRRQRELAERFLAASSAGDLDGLIGLLAHDVVVYSDGGGKVVAARRPIFGRERVASFLARVAPLGWRAGYQSRFAEVNGQPGFLIEQDGRPIAVLVLDVAEGLVQTVRFIWNPDKLRHLLQDQRP
jgi:RNA polymerase sigma-70 factor (ECF subfamily)